MRGRRRSDTTANESIGASAAIQLIIAVLLLDVRPGLGLVRSSCSKSTADSEGDRWTSYVPDR